MGKDSKVAYLGPPRLGVYLLTATLQASVADHELGDLEEEYHAIAKRHGAASARRWFWNQAVRTLFITLRNDGIGSVVRRYRERSLSPIISLAAGPADYLLEEEMTRVEVIVRSFKFYFELTLKATTFFYAVMGTLLTLCFTKGIGGNAAAGIMMLAILLSFVLGLCCFNGRRHWHQHAAYVRRLGERLQFKLPEVHMLGPIFQFFGASYFFTSAALLVLLVKILK